MATTKELKILITIANEAKDGLTNLLQNLVSMREQLEALSTGLSDIGKDTTGLETVGGAAEQATNKLENTTEALHGHGENAAGGSGGAGGNGGNGHNGTNGENGANHNPDPNGHQEEEAHRRNTQNAQEHAASIHRLSESFETLLKWVNFVAGGFLGLEAIHLSKEILDVAARTETLGVVLKVVGQNAGYTVAELDKTDKAVQKLGITAEASRESLAELIKAGIDLSLAPRLARASQDLAVVAGQNSSDTFKRLIANIDQMDTLGLRFMGVMLNKEDVMAKAANDAGRAITGVAQKQIFANAVLDESEKLAGVYAASMNTAGKMLTSFPRYVEEFKDALGTLGQGVYVEVIKGATEIVKALTELAASFKEVGPNAETFGEDVAQAGDHSTGLAGAVRSVSKALVEVIEFIKEHREGLTTLVLVLRDVALGFAVAWGITQVLAFHAAISAALPAAIGLFGTLSTTLVAVASRFGLMWLAALGPIGAVLAGVGLLAGAVYALWKLLGDGPDTDKNKAGDHIKENTKLTNDYLAALKEQQKLLQQNDELIEKRKVSAAKATVGSPEDQARYKKEVEDYTTKINANTTQIDKLNTRKETDKKAIDKNGTLDEENSHRIKAGEEEAAKYRKLLNDAREFENTLSTNLQKVGLDVSAYSNGVSQKFNEVSGAVDTMVSGLTRKQTDVPKAISAISAALGKAAEAATNDSELKKYEELESRTLVDLQKRVGAEQFEQLRIASSNRIAIQRKVVEENNKVEEAGSAKALAILNQRAKQESEFRVAALQRDVERRKALFDLDLSNQQFNLDQGLESLKEYAAARNKEISDTLEQEKSLSQEKIASLNVKIKALPATDTEGRAKLQEDIRAEQDRMVQADIKAQRDRASVIVDTYNKQIRAEQSIAQTRNDLNTRYGHEEVTIKAEIAQKLEEELKIINTIGTKQDIANATERARLETLTRVSQLKLDQQKKELDNERAYIDLLDARANSSQEDGQSTSLETQTLINENITRRMGLLEEERTEVLRVRDALAEAGDNYGALAKNTQAIELTKQMYSLRDSVKSVGKELEQTFTNSLADNLDQLLSGTKKFKDAFLDIFKDLNKQIMKSMTKDFAENFTKAIKGDGKDGGGIFSSLASLVTGKPDASKPEVPKENTEQLLAKGFDSIKDIIPPKMITSATQTVEKLEEIRKNTEAMVKAREAQDQPQKSTEEKAKEKQDDLNSSIKPFDVNTANQVLGKKGVLKDDAGLADSPIFDQAAKAFNLEKYNLNGDFLKYMATKESGLNPKAVSPAGASGLMQLMPDTAKGLGLAQVDILDPMKNVMAGARLMAQLLDRYNGDLTKALAAYNAGPKVADARSAGDFSKQSPANKAQTDDYIAKLGPNSKIFSKPTATEPMPVVVTGKRLPKDDVAPVAEAAKAANPEEQQIQQLVVTATRDQVAAAKEEADTAEKNSTATTENTAKVVDSTTQITTFTQSIAAATVQLSAMATAKGAEPGQAINTGLAPGKDGMYPVDTTAPASTAAAPEKSNWDDFFKTIGGPLSMFASAGVGSLVTKSMGKYKGGDPDGDPALARAKAESAQRSAQAYGGVAALVTNIASQKVLKSLFDPLKDNLKSGFKDVGDGSKDDVQGMTGDVMGSLGTFLSSLGKALSDFFSSGASGGSGGGLGGMLSSIFGGGGGTGGGVASSGEYAAADFLAFAEGGYVSGAGTGTSDSINAKLSHGEYVMTAKQTNRYLPLLEAMRSGSLDTTLGDMFSGLNIHVPTTPMYATGGYVSESAIGGNAGNSNNSKVSVTMHVHAQDANSFNRSKDQIAAKTGQAVNRAVRRNT